MTPTEAAISRLLDMVTDNPRFLHPVITDDFRLLLAQRDRYEKALREIAEGDWTDARDIAQEALRCE